jgi:hypothetical protein
MLQLFSDAGYRIVKTQGLRPSRSLKFRLLNAFLLGALEDFRYLQYALVAEPVERRSAPANR